MIDVAPDIAAELLANAAVVSITTRVRVEDPSPAIYAADGSLLDAGDVRGGGEYVAYVLIRLISNNREKGPPIQHPTYGLLCYGATRHQAIELHAAVSDALHNKGPRKGTALIYRSFDESDEGPQPDPDTGQPYVTASITVHAATVAA